MDNTRDFLKLCNDVDRFVGSSYALRAEHADHHGQRSLFLGLQEQAGQQIVIPRAHGHKDQQRHHDGRQHGQDDIEEQPYASAAVDHGSLIDLHRDGIQEAAHQKYREGHIETGGDVYDRDQAVGKAQPGRIELDQRDHECLKRSAHGGDHEIIEEGDEFAFNTADHVSRHGAKDGHQHANADREHKGICQCRKEVSGQTDISDISASEPKA